MKRGGLVKGGIRMLFADSPVRFSQPLWAVTFMPMPMCPREFVEHVLGTNGYISMKFVELVRRGHGHGHECRSSPSLKEIQIMKQLDHPNICKCLETFESGRRQTSLNYMIDQGSLSKFNVS